MKHCGECGSDGHSTGSCCVCGSSKHTTKQCRIPGRLSLLTASLERGLSVEEAAEGAGFSAVLDVSGDKSPYEWAGRLLEAQPPTHPGQKELPFG